MTAAKKSTGSKRPSSIPRHPAGGTRARAFAGAGAKSKGDEPKFSAGGDFSGAFAGAPLGLDNLFGWLGSVVGQLNDLAEKAEGFQKQGEFDIPGLGENARGIYGVSVKMGLGGEPAVQTFGNIHPTKKGPEVSDVREPLVDVFDEEDEVLIIAEMPGVAEKDIATKVSGKTLQISTKGDYRYSKDVELPAPVKAKSTRKTYRNGLLEMRFAKA